MLTVRDETFKFQIMLAELVKSSNKILLVTMEFYTLLTVHLFQQARFVPTRSLQHRVSSTRATLRPMGTIVVPLDL